MFACARRFWWFLIVDLVGCGVSGICLIWCVVCLIVGVWIWLFRLLSVICVVGELC